MMVKSEMELSEASVHYFHSLLKKEKEYGYINEFIVILPNSHSNF